VQVDEAQPNPRSATSEDCEVLAVL